MGFNLTIQQLKESERSVFSQGGQDGVLEAIFNQLGVSKGTAVEFGARDGVELSNTANLRINSNWYVLLMDDTPLSDKVRKANIRPENINYVIAEWFKFRQHINYMSIDIDGNDFWVWEAFSQTPEVITIEYNSKFRNDESYTIEYNPDHKWEGDDYYGASLLALKKLGKKKGYTLVYVVDRFDAVFVRNNFISPEYVVPTLDELLPEPIIAHEKISNKKWVIV